MDYHVKKFTELSVPEFYRIVTERIAVFVVEQNCPYQEVDEVDPQALHTYFADEAGNILAYTRIFEEGDAVHFGRVLVAGSQRKNGLGRKIVENTLKVIEENYPNQPIIIGAQEYLQEFYQSFGFKAVSDVYLEDDIPHIDMKMEAN